MTELTDRMLLSNMDAHMGKGIVLDGRTYARPSDETPFAFINRVRDEHNAWKASQETPKDVKSRRAGVGDAGKQQDQLNRGVQSGNKATIQESQTSLDAILESQVASLRRRADDLNTKINQHLVQVTELKSQLSKVEQELQLADKFFKEVRSSASSVHDETRSNLSNEVSAEQSESS